MFLRWQALGQLMTMFALLGGVYYLSMLYDAPSRNPAVSCLVCVCVWGGVGGGGEACLPSNCCYNDGWWGLSLGALACCKLEAGKVWEGASPSLLAPLQWSFNFRGLHLPISGKHTTKVTGTSS